MKERVIIGEHALGPIHKPNRRVDDGFEYREQVTRVIGHRLVGG